MTSHHPLNFSELMIKTKIMFDIAEENSVLVVGGYYENRLNTAELIPNSCNIPGLPKVISGLPSLVITSDNNILLCGGANNEQECLQLTSTYTFKYTKRIRQILESKKALFLQF